MKFKKVLNHKAPRSIDRQTPFRDSAFFKYIIQKDRPKSVDFFGRPFSFGLVMEFSYGRL